MIILPMASLASAFMTSSFAGKLIVVALFLGSAVAWTIMLSKWAELSRESRLARAFLERFREANDPLSIVVRGEALPDSAVVKIYAAGTRALADELKLIGIDLMTLSEGELVLAHRRLTRGQLESLRAIADRHVADGILELETKMGALATAVSAAPFVGLLGTVWGVMESFEGMAASGSAALSEVAPGIAAALLTTILGLFVALPSMVGYNMLSGKIREISVQMDNFAQEFISALQKEYVAIEGEE